MGCPAFFFLALPWQCSLLWKIRPILAMQTSSKETALTMIFKSSSYITNKHHKKKRNPQHVECSDFYIIQRTGKKPDYSFKCRGTTKNTAKVSSRSHTVGTGSVASFARSLQTSIYLCARCSHWQIYCCPRRVKVNSASGNMVSQAKFLSMGVFLGRQWSSLSLR